jgi:hypothetical protein
MAFMEECFCLLRSIRMTAIFSCSETEALDPGGRTAE